MHFVLQCPKYSLQHRVYFGPLGRNEQRLDYLHSTKEGADRLLKHVTATRRLRRTLSDLKSVERDDKNGSGGGNMSGKGRGCDVRHWNDDRSSNDNARRRLRQTTLNFHPNSS